MRWQWRFLIFPPPKPFPVLDDDEADDDDDDDDELFSPMFMVFFNGQFAAADESREKRVTETA